MSFSKYLEEQIKKHPSMQPQDIVKLCYQAAYGDDHLVYDKNALRSYLERKCSRMHSNRLEMFENISDDICRVNLAAWINSSLPLAWLFDLFLLSSKQIKGTRADFINNVNKADKVILDSAVSFSYDDWTSYIDEYKKLGIHSVYHSPQYHKREMPAYNVISRKYVYLIPVLKEICTRVHVHFPFIIAIDGRCASGKSTMAEDLKSIIHADIIKTDHFFLPPSGRSKERLNEPGGNIDHERFNEEIISAISSPYPFSYRAYDCHTDTYSDVNIGDNYFRIVEGSYSCHPAFGKYADLTVFVDIDNETQLQRIEERNCHKEAEVFKDNRIPLEEDYFKSFKIKEQADIVL